MILMHWNLCSIFTNLSCSQVPEASRVRVARWDPNDPHHVAVAEEAGVLTSIRVSATGGTLRSRFQLHTRTTGPGLAPVHRPWVQFEFLPGIPNAVLLFQQDSNKLLYANLAPAPQAGVDPDSWEFTSPVYAIGAHPGEFA